MDARTERITVLHHTGSPTSQRWADLSHLYARSAYKALEDVTDDLFEHIIADVSPDGTWRFPTTLAPEDLELAPSLTLAESLATIAELNAQIAVPQLFCQRGLTEHRSLLSTLGIASVGNCATVMAITIDKSVTRAVMAAAGIAVPRATLVRSSKTLPMIDGPVVVKPVDGDNSSGITLVDSQSSLAHAVDKAMTSSHAALIEDFIPLGREVRCGTVRHNDKLRALPLEEYAVNAHTKPIRGEDDKLACGDGGDLELVAKDLEYAWIVPDGDPIVAAVHKLALSAHDALGCRHHGLVDIRVDPSGKPWFLEAGPYCSFSPQSVIVTMAAATGIDLRQLFIDAVDTARHQNLLFKA